MRRIGILGGMSPESTALYYRLMVDGVRDQSTDFTSPDLLIHSVNFQMIRHFQDRSDWDAAGAELARSASKLQAAGAEAILLATNTMHLCADMISAAIDVPFLHIADATATALKSIGADKAALFGTRATMEKDFYRHRLQEVHGIEVWTPDVGGRAEVNRIIFEELVKGDFRDASRAVFAELAGKARLAGSRAAILGCTEIGLLVDESHLGLPAICSARAHVSAALDFMFD